MFNHNSYLDEVFQGLSLAREAVSGIEFEQCVFESCDFSQAQFRQCRFIQCRFVQCNLSLASLGFSLLNELAFDECKLIGVDWTQAQWPQFSSGFPISFRHCLLDSGSFMGLSLKQIQMLHCRAHDVDFRDADLRQADMSGTSFTDSVFMKTDLTAANFTDATNYSIDVKHNAVAKAIFSRFEALSLLESLGIELVD